MQRDRSASTKRLRRFDPRSFQPILSSGAIRSQVDDEPAKVPHAGEGGRIAGRLTYDF
jgi:hypothetical protein